MDMAPGSYPPWTYPPGFVGLNAFVTSSRNIFNWVLSIRIQIIRCISRHLRIVVVGPRNPIRKSISPILRKGLNGLSYIGMIEPGLYINVSVEPTRKQGVSWHSHLIVWGCSRDELRARFQALNKRLDRYQPIAKGLVGAHYKPIPAGLTKHGRPHLADKFRYTLKSPKDSYHVFWARHPKSGNRRVLRHKGRKLRPGERLRLFHALKYHYLDQLSMAGGEGKEILRRAKICALKPASPAPRSLAPRGRRTGVARRGTRVTRR